MLYNSINKVYSLYNMLELLVSDDFTNKSEHF